MELKLAQQLEDTSSLLYVRSPTKLVRRATWALARGVPTATQSHRPAPPRPAPDGTPQGVDPKVSFGA